MKHTLKAKVVAVNVEFTEDESDDINYWFGNRNSSPSAPAVDQGKQQRGFQRMVDLCELLREGFHKDGD
jgi:hypothetical protein